ncbi:hypothetical protein GE21DRAFT_9401 [Neurospora crassa]|uniref:F-box domain-containing protein n=1 Tax=Neurospora crassa (strain ATCC 24698 / 74-OR23-1A / CBS 708.71 / DSM 1257 / FGSC 987) TaxID=367110 RepID=V5ILP3_NEUCR|nr:hypothetical protein NCU12130 [Neurospora crassa OR74A]ESA42295.1 hypothetical protein NCU12130 [Neurospora crassa OR74A]KHE87528.1 hypothetical protein GE21DRAFT_9401 [Neurospora crassa]|eukprot:XP_011395060.1 hypothetical protein NCU12130 [Neurospora crassa OR74A]
MAPLPLQSGAGQRQIWSWPTVEEERDEEQLEESTSVQFASQTSQMTLLSSGSTPLPVMERSEGSSREWDGMATGGVNNILTDIRPDTRAIVRLSEHRKESDTNFEKTGHHVQLTELPNEVLYEILSHLDVCDLFSTSKTSHHLRTLSTSPTLHTLRLRRARLLLPLSLTSPSRPSLADLIRRSIFLTNTALMSRKLARKLASIHLARRLAARPSAEQLVERCVLPAECVPCGTRKKVMVAPALVAKKRAVERERVKDGLRGWIGEVWMGRVKEREGKVRKEEEETGVGRVWRLRRFWEGVSRGRV